MARQTITRAELRRNIATRLSMPFALRIPSGYATATGGTTTTLIDTTNLLQADDTWNNQWALLLSTGADVIRKITDFSQATKSLTLEYASPVIPSSDVDYEIHSIYNAIEIHNAINQAIQSAFPAFFDTTEDASIVVQEDKLEYSLTTISPAIHRVHEVWLERPSHRIQATVASYSNDGTDGTLVLDSCDLGGVDNDWKLSCYNGVAEGELHDVKSVVAGTYSVTIDGLPTVNFVDGDKILLWDAREQYDDWYRLKFIRITPKEWPSKLHITAGLDGFLGCRIKIIYTTVPQKLTADSSTTVVPEEYVTLSAMATLFASRMNDNRVDRQRYAILHEEYLREAELYKRMNAFRAPDIDMFLEGEDEGISDLRYDGNPMGWR
jgi:hypothetical protein